MAGAFIADHTAAFQAAIGTLLAIISRSQTGRGQHVDVAAMDAMFSCLGTIPAAYAMTGKIPRRTGNCDAITVPANVYRASDGYMYIHAGTDPLFPRLCTAMERPDLVQDARFTDQALRLAHVTEIDPIVSSWTSGLSCTELSKRLTAAGIPHSKVATIPDVVESEQVEAREMLISMTHPQLGELRLIGNPIKLSETPAVMRKAPPMAGEDNDQVYGGLLGLDAREIAALRAQSAI
jgi:crotonobetainyl-CoA:carnitine CoA-transferase CaiB-like acyl-CoA transferase